MVVESLFLHDDGLSAYQRRFKQEPTVGVAQFGEVVLCKAHGKHDVANAYSLFTRGMWIGRQWRTLDSKLAWSFTIASHKKGLFHQKSGASE